MRRHGIRLASFVCPVHSMHSPGTPGTTTDSRSRCPTHGIGCCRMLEERVQPQMDTCAPRNGNKLGRSTRHKVTGTVSSSRLRHATPATRSVSHANPPPASLALAHGEHAAWRYSRQPHTWLTNTESRYGQACYSVDDTLGRLARYCLDTPTHCNSFALNPRRSQVASGLRLRHLLVVWIQNIGSESARLATSDCVQQVGRSSARKRGLAASAMLKANGFVLQSGVTIGAHTNTKTCRFSIAPSASLSFSLCRRPTSVFQTSAGSLTACWQVNGAGHCGRPGYSVRPWILVGMPLHYCCHES